MKTIKCSKCNIEDSINYIDDCKECGKFICEKCQVSYTLHNQIDYCLCHDCYQNTLDRRSLNE